MAETTWSMLNEGFRGTFCRRRQTTGRGVFTWNLLIERYQYSTELEERICSDRKLEIVPQHNHNTISLCDTEVFETVG